MTEVPMLFVSYSHDSREHMQWVGELASRLRQNGIDAILDQWDLGPGDDTTRFMEGGLTTSGRVLVICTDNYVRKANAGEGGVGYERMIVTGELVSNLGTDKFIPIIRRVAGQQKTPVFLATRFYVDLSDDSQFDEQFQVLLRELHKVPKVSKPPLGKNPFSVLPSGAEAPLGAASTAPPATIPESVDSPSEIYQTALKLARHGDLLGWRQLIKRVRSPVYKALIEWRKADTRRALTDLKQLPAMLDEAVQITAPLIVVALTGVESGREQLKNQKSFIDDLLNITGWERSNDLFIADLPRTLAFLFHSLHGALCANTGQLGLAMDLATMKVASLNHKPLPISKQHDFTGWYLSIDDHCTNAWRYISNSAKKWSWVEEAFGGEADFRVGLVAYYMALSVNELADFLTSGNMETLQLGGVRLDVPACFAMEEVDINRRAVALLLRDLNQFRGIWTRHGVKDEHIRAAWPRWVQVIHAWLAAVNHWAATREFPYSELITAEEN